MNRLCGKCSRGVHPHDRWTQVGNPGHAGEDAGCPMMVAGGECGCTVRLPRQSVCQACGRAS